MSLLPFNRRPGTDLLSKGILSSSSVIRIIEERLDLPHNEYQPVNNEWLSGERSDVVLAAKSLDYPPLVIEIQNTINDKSMKKLVDYCREAEKTARILPIAIVLNTNTISKSVASTLKPSKIEGCKEYSCQSWAERCLVFNKTFVKQPMKHGLNPFTALGLFLAEGDLSLTLRKFRDDETFQLLYELAWMALEQIEDQQKKSKTEYQELKQEFKGFLSKVIHKLRRKEPVEQTVAYIEGYKEALLKRDREEEEEEEEEEAPTKKRIRVLYSDEEKEFLLEFRKNNQDNTFEDCRLAGVDEGLFIDRKWRDKKSLFTRLQKKK